MTAEKVVAPEAETYSAREGYLPYSRYSPRPFSYWLLHLQKAVRRALAPSVPLSVRVRRSEDPRLAGRVSLVWWSYDPQRLGARLHLTFESGDQITHYDARWRIIAHALWKLIQHHPSVVFHDVPVDINDGCGLETPPFVFAFARPRGTFNLLLPNPYLLDKFRKVPGPIPWEKKSDLLYFRGADSGSSDLDLNSRVTLCRIAATLPRADCKISRLLQGEPAFVKELYSTNLVGNRQPLTEMNRHRFLVDVDGNTTSWDRYAWIGTFGGVPILFEPAYEECWHHYLINGENCILADRHNLADVLQQLRSNPESAQRIAQGATKLVVEKLNPSAVQAMFETAWLDGLSAKL